MVVYKHRRKDSERMSGSEIARLRQRLEDEYTAGRRALYGLASGWAKHQFISRRLSNMDDCRLELERLVGKEEAMRIVCETLEAARSRAAARQGRL
jgi:hypothetical protein